MSEGFWRDVPCGHPPDPVAAVGPDGLPTCHCGWILDAGGPLFQSCPKCGCYVALWVPTEAELA